jgi:hypothetical protein
MAAFADCIAWADGPIAPSHLPTNCSYRFGIQIKRAPKVDFDFRSNETGQRALSSALSANPDPRNPRGSKIVGERDAAFETYLDWLRK